MVVFKHFEANNIKSVRKLIAEAEDRYGLTPGTLKENTISQRISTAKDQNVLRIVTKSGPIGPTEGAFEEILIETILEYDMMCKTLTFSEILEIANSLVQGTDAETKILKKKAKESNECNNDSTLGKKWLKSFLQRKEGILK